VDWVSTKGGVARWGAPETEQLLIANNTEPSTVLRPYGIVREQLETMLEDAGVDVSESPLLRDSIQLPHGVSLTELGAFRKGLFFVQDPASTLVTQYADVPPDARVADLCAAPGGKTLELSRTASLVVAGDRNLHRTQRLLENLRRVEARNISSVVMDARHPAVREMDAVLIDVPCTGTGTLRRHP